MHSTGSLGYVGSNKVESVINKEPGRSYAVCVIEGIHSNPLKIKVTTQDIPEDQAAEKTFGSNRSPTMSVQGLSFLH